MRALPLFALGCLALAGCGKTTYESEQQIVGTWQWSEKDRGSETTLTLEFTRTGKVHASGAVSDQTFSTSGKYRFLDERTFEVRRNSEDGPTVEVSTIEVLSADKLVTCNAQGQKVEFRRLDY